MSSSLTITFHICNKTHCMPVQSRFSFCTRIPQDAQWLLRITVNDKLNELLMATEFQKQFIKFLFSCQNMNTYCAVRVHF